MGIEDALRRLDGVDSVETDLLSKSVRVTPSDGRAVELAAIRPAVWSVGYAVQRMRIVASGTFEDSEGERRFRIDGWTTAFPVDGAGATTRCTVDAHVETGGKGTRLDDVRVVAVGGR